MHETSLSVWLVLLSAPECGHKSIPIGFLSFSAFFCETTHLHESKLWIYTSTMTLESFLTLSFFFFFFLLYKLWKLLHRVVFKVK